MTVSVFQGSGWEEGWDVDFDTGNDKFITTAWVQVYNDSSNDPHDSTGCSRNHTCQDKFGLGAWNYYEFAEKEGCGIKHETKGWIGGLHKDRHYYYC